MSKHTHMLFAALQVVVVTLRISSTRMRCHSGKSRDIILINMLRNTCITTKMPINNGKFVGSPVI